MARSSKDKVSDMKLNVRVIILALLPLWLAGMCLSGCSIQEHTTTTVEPETSTHRVVMTSDNPPPTKATAQEAGDIDVVQQSFVPYFIGYNLVPASCNTKQLVIEAESREAYNLQLQFLQNGKWVLADPVHTTARINGKSANPQSLVVGAGGSFSIAYTHATLKEVRFRLLVERPGSHEKTFTPPTTSTVTNCR